MRGAWDLGRVSQTLTVELTLGRLIGNGADDRVFLGQLVCPVLEHRRVLLI